MVDRVRAHVLTGLAMGVLVCCGARSPLDTEAAGPDTAVSSSGTGSSSGSTTGSGNGGASGSSSGVGGGAGSSGGSPGAGSSGGATPGTTGTVPCGTTTCNAATSQCCLQMTRAGAVQECAPAGELCTAGIALGCYGAANCPSGDICCLSIGADAGRGGAMASCQSLCAVTQGSISIQLCQSTAECPAGLTCSQTTLGVGACN